MSRTSHDLVPIVLCIMGVSVLVFSGCEREPEVPSHAPESYMKDKAFREGLSNRRVEMQQLAATCRQTSDRMQALVDKYGEDEAKLKTIPEWNELKARLTELNVRYLALKKEQQGAVRARLTPQKEVSK